MTDEELAEKILSECETGGHLTSRIMALLRAARQDRLAGCEERVREIQGRESAATSGEWKSDWGRASPFYAPPSWNPLTEEPPPLIGTRAIILADDRHIATVWEHEGHTHPQDDIRNSAFIANARQDIPYLLTLVADLRTLLAEAQDDSAAYRNGVEEGLRQGKGDATVPTFKGQPCHFEDCTEPAVTIACGRKGYSADEPGHPDPAPYCKAHAAVVVDENNPEYHDWCPNCGCGFGVN